MNDNQYDEFLKGFTERFKRACDGISILEYVDAKGLSYHHESGSWYVLDGMGFDSLKINANSNTAQRFSTGDHATGVYNFAALILRYEGRVPSHKDIQAELISYLGTGRFPDFKVELDIANAANRKGFKEYGSGAKAVEGPTEQKSHLDYVPKNATTSIGTMSDEDKGEFALPQKDVNNGYAIQYLCNERKLDREIVDYFIEKGLIYGCVHTSKSGYVNHNIAFVGVDKEGKARACEEKYTKPYKDKNGDLKKSNSVKGSDKTFSFSYVPSNAPLLRCFEATVDALSWLSLLKMQRNDDSWKNYAFLVLEGVGQNWGTIPKALIRCLYDNPQIRKVVTCFDNDEVGVGASDSLVSFLADPYEGAYRINNKGLPVNSRGFPVIVRSYDVDSKRAPYGKDWNDTLKETVRIIMERRKKKGFPDNT